MDSILAVIAWVSSNALPVAGAVAAACTALAALFLLIPGEQPEKFFQGVADFLKKFSAK